MPARWEQGAPGLIAPFWVVVSSLSLLCPVVFIFPQYLVKFLDDKDSSSPGKQLEYRMAHLYRGWSEIN